MKILQKIKEWKLNRPESQWSKKKLAIAGAALVVIVSHSGVAVAAFPASMAPQLPQNSLVVSR